MKPTKFLRVCPLSVSVCETGLRFPRMLIWWNSAFNLFVWSLSSHSKNFSVIWRRHHCRWRATNFYLCLALMAIEQWGSVYNGHLQGPVTLTPVAELLAVQLHGTTSFYDSGLSRPGIEQRSPACKVHALPVSHRGGPPKIKHAVHVKSAMTSATGHHARKKPLCIYTHVYLYVYVHVYIHVNVHVYIGNEQTIKSNFPQLHLKTMKIWKLFSFKTRLYFSR